MSRFDVVALGELLIDFTNNADSEQGNPMFEANPGGAPCNVLSMLGSGTRATSRPYYNDSYAPLQRETVNS